MAEEDRKEKRMEERMEKKSMPGLSKLLGEGKIRNFLREGEIEIPEKPGPKVVGREPVIGSIRRSMGLPVFRDELPTLIEIEK